MASETKKRRAQHPLLQNNAYLSNLNENRSPPNNLNYQNLFPPLPFTYPPSKAPKVKAVKQVNYAEEKRIRDLLEAVQKDTTEETEQLLQQGVNPNRMYPKQILFGHVVHQPLFFWATLPNLRVLLDHGADPNLPSSDGNTLLNTYCSNHARSALHPEKDKIDEIRLLVNKGVDVNIPSDSGDTPLHSVCRYSIDHIVVRLLLENGADPNLQNKRGQTPLHCISENHLLGHTRYDIPFTESIQLLIRAGADPTIHDEEEHTPSEHATLQEIPIEVTTALHHAEQGLPLPPHPGHLTFPAPAPAPNVPEPQPNRYDNMYEQNLFNYQEAQNNQFGGRRRRKARKTRKGRKHAKRTHRRRHPHSRTSRRHTGH